MSDPFVVFAAILWLVPASMWLTYPHELRTGMRAYRSLLVEASVFGLTAGMFAAALT